MSPSTAADLRDLLDALARERQDVLAALSGGRNDELAAEPWGDRKREIQQARARVQRTREALEDIDLHGALLELDELARGA